MRDRSGAYLHDDPRRAKTGERDGDQRAARDFQGKSVQPGGSAGPHLGECEPQALMSFSVTAFNRRRTMASGKRQSITVVLLILGIGIWLTQSREGYFEWQAWI